ncbi:hypothetical protein HN011_004685 [Eciton burchellii]|nr:hypothetical protein HN011_004685 [Eciton burchellii]
MRNAISEQRGAAASTAFARDLFIRLHPSSTASNLRPFHGIFTFPLLSLFITAVSPIITAVDGGNRSQAEAPLRALASSRFLSGIGEVKPLPEARLPLTLVAGDERTSSCILASRRGIRIVVSKFSRTETVLSPRAFGLRAAMPFRPRDILLFVLTLVPRDALPKTANSDMAEILHRPIRSLTFPENSNMGIFVALAVPLEDPLNSVSLSYFFEANYVLPPNITYLEPWTVRKRRRRNIDRTTIYRVLESKFESFGYPGRECLLRAICETSEHPIRHNGIIGDIVHVIFTPSASRSEGLPQDVNEAEVVGRDGSCFKYRPQCPLGLFDLIGILA